MQRGATPSRVSCYVSDSVRLAEIQENNQPIDRNAKPEKLGFKPRPFVQLASQVAGRWFKVMSFNVRSALLLDSVLIDCRFSCISRAAASDSKLMGRQAQALVKRDLFPGCDLLKWHQRGPVLMREVVYYSPDVACMQEVDRLSDHAPELEKAGYALKWENGYPDKLHGLLIAWKSSMFKKVGEHYALIDDLAFSSEPDRPDGQKGHRRTGLTRVTRNVGLCLALAFADDPSKGVIVATHHLFWHARHLAERARQTGLWLREVREFRRSKPEWKGWPLVFTSTLR